MKTIHKYILTPDLNSNQIKIEAPIDMKPISVAFQGGNLCVWGLVETNDPNCNMF